MTVAEGEQRSCTVTIMRTYVYVNWRADNWHDILAEFKERFVPPAKFESHTKCWALPLDYKGELVAWANKVFGAFYVRVDDMTKGSHRSGDYYQRQWEQRQGERSRDQHDWSSSRFNSNTHGQQHQAPPPPARPAPGDPYGILFVLPGAPREVVKAAYKALALLSHPDHGGDEQRMKDVNNAYDQIKATQGWR